jgi:lysophospholipase L1-like esterase
MTSDEYYTRLVTLIHEVQKVAKVNIPWLVARATYGSGKISESVRSAQKRLWDDGIALPGPDTDSLGQPYRETSDGVHFNEAGTREVAQLWVKKIKAAFFDNNYNFFNRNSE